MKNIISFRNYQRNFMLVNIHEDLWAKRDGTNYAGFPFFGKTW
jgi:hypothetical protein